MTTQTKREQSTTSDFGKFYSPIEVAEILNVSRGTVYMLRNSGELKPIRIGRSLRFAASEVQRYLDERTSEAEAY